MTTRKGHNGGDYTPEACGNPEAKENTRRLAIEIAQQSPCLWSRSRNALRYDWMELAGKFAPTLQTLRSTGALGGRRFLGVDTAADIIRECEAHYGRDDAVWIHGTLRDILEGAGHIDTVARVGVLVYDSHDGVHASDIDRTLRPLFDFAHRQRAIIGEFLLILNLAAVYRVAKKQDMDRYIDRYTKVLSEGLGAPVSADDIHRYTSNKTQMLWVALRFGF